MPFTPEQSAEIKKQILQQVEQLPQENKEEIKENIKSIALLEINPLSKRHSIVLPKQQTTTEKIPKSAMTLAQKIAKKIKTKLKPDDIKIETSSFQNYPMINII